jgi:glycosyltransferase involved in cell wall biosynthesis
MQQKYSIILPVRNGGHHVKECIKSILLQTYTDFNLIVLDNCSTDGTKEWISSLKEERIKIIPATTPLTIEENWGRIREIYKNEFITLIGHDDILAPHYLQVMNDLIKQHPQASLYQSHFTYINSEGDFLSQCKSMPAHQTASQFLKSFLTNSIDIMGTGFLMRSKDYDAMGGIRPYPNLLFADLELWYKLTQISFMVTAPEVCFSFRLHQSTTRTTSDEKLLHALERMIYFLEKIKEEDNKVAKIIQAEAITFIHYYCRSVSHRLLRTPKNMRNGITVDGVIKKCKTFADILLPGNNYQPLADSKVKLALYINGNVILRQLFLLFKKLYSKPVYR